MKPSLGNPKSYVFLYSIRLFAHVVECNSVSTASMYLDLVDKMLALRRWMAISEFSFTLVSIDLPICPM